MPRRITPSTTIANLRKEAKRWLKALRANVTSAHARLRRVFPSAAQRPTLREVQHALALEHGLPAWSELKRRLVTDAPIHRYEGVAEALVRAYRTGEDRAMHVVCDYFGHRRTWDAMRRYVRLDLGRPEEPPSAMEDDITPEEARHLVARAQGFESWAALVTYIAALPPRPGILARSVTIYAADGTGSREVAAQARDWEEAIALVRDRRMPGLHASGQMNDALLERISRLDHISILDLSGSRGVTDEGLRHLPRLPRLSHLNLSRCAITDHGLEILGRLPALQSIDLAWTDITDTGVAHLAGCPDLRKVDLSGTRTGDGAIRSLAGKHELREFRSGNDVTDVGLALLHELPEFKTWRGGEPEMGLLRFDAGPNYLMLRGTFTDAGLARLVGLDGLFALNLDSDQLAITGAGLSPLVDLPHLAWLAFDAADDSMPHIAALPHLRFLMCQDTVATDDGFVALGRSRSIEYIWGRRCYNLRRRGFMALAEMPKLAHLSVSCRNVDDVGLSVLPQFPSLRELMPMDVADDGFRHVGQCQQLESVVLMYCRETTDLATQHIASLRSLKKYFASYTRITDRTPEILSGIPSLEEVAFDSCAGLSNAGIATLVRLPRLRELRVESMPNVTAAVTDAFGPRVRVRYST